MRIHRGHDDMVGGKSVRSSIRPVQYAQHGHVARVKEQQPQEAWSRGLEHRELRTRPRTHWVCAYTGRPHVNHPSVGASLIVQTMVTAQKPCGMIAKTSQVYARIHFPTSFSVIDAHSFGFFIPGQGPVWPMQLSS